jgi:hypothetical protein
MNAVATWNLGISQHLLYDKGKLKNKLYRDCRSDDLSLESGTKRWKSPSVSLNMRAVALFII